MNKSTIRQFVLRHSLTRELFFFVGGKKANLKRIDRVLAKDNIKLAKEKAENVIVSLTSYGKRIPELKYTLYSLVVQSIRPEKIVVNIAFEDEKYINNELKSFEKYGVEFFYCENLRSYKKLIPTLERYPNACIVTTDDDVCYPSDWLKKLYEEHLLYPNDVCCHIVHQITYENNRINTYSKWIHNINLNGKDRKNILLGVGGVLYPPNILYKDVLMTNLFLRLAPLADDIWFYFMVVLNGKNIRKIDNSFVNLCYVNPYREYGIADGGTLTQQNVGENKNDIQFRNVLAYYGISEQKFIEYLEGKIDCLI